MILIILLGGEKLKNAFLSSCLNQNLYPITGSEGVNAVFGSDAFGNTAFAQNGTIGGLRYGVAFGFGSFDESCGSFQVASKMLNRIVIWKDLTLAFLCNFSKMIFIGKLFRARS